MCDSVVSSIDNWNLGHHYGKSGNGADGKWMQGHIYVEIGVIEVRKCSHDDWASNDSRSGY